MTNDRGLIEIVKEFADSEGVRFIHKKASDIGGQAQVRPDLVFADLAELIAFVKSLNHGVILSEDRDYQGKLTGKGLCLLEHDDYIEQIMGGLGFGQGYFGQYATGGTVPPDFPAEADVIVLIGADVERVLIEADVERVLISRDIKRVRNT